MDVFPFWPGGLDAGVLSFFRAGLLGCVGEGESFFWVCLDGVELCEDPEPDDELFGILAGGVELLLGRENSVESLGQPSLCRLRDLCWARLGFFTGLSVFGDTFLGGGRCERVVSFLGV